MRRVNGLFFSLFLFISSTSPTSADIAENLREEFLPFLPAETPKEPDILEPERHRLLAEEYLAGPKKRPQPLRILRTRAIGALLEMPIPYTGMRLGKLLDSGGLIDSSGSARECRPIQLIQRIDEYNEHGERVGERLKLKPRLQAPIPFWGKCAVFGVKKLRSVEGGVNGEEGKKKTTGAMLTVEFKF